MSVVVIDDDVFLEHASPGHPECADRLVAIRRALSASGFDALIRHGAGDAGDDDILAVHDGSLLESVDAMAAAGGGWFDADTYCRSASAMAARRAAGAAMLGVDVAVSGAHAVALTRPPGHHATAATPMGFCLFNNVAIAARHAQRAHGIERIAIVDIDVHHGNGTQDIFYADGDVFYASIHQSPCYPGTGSVEEHGTGDGDGTTVNLPVAEGTGALEWLDIFDRVVLPRVKAHAPGLILVSAGFDAHRDDPLADLRLESQTYAAIADRLSGLSAELGGAATAWCLEGGYNLAALGESVAAVVAVLDGRTAA